MKYYLARNTSPLKPIEDTKIIWTKNEKDLTSLEQIDKLTTEAGDEWELKHNLSRIPGTYISLNTNAGLNVRFMHKGENHPIPNGIAYSDALPYLDPNKIKDYLRNILDLGTYDEEEFAKRRALTKALLKEYGAIPALNDMLNCIHSYMYTYEDKNEIVSMMRQICNMIMYRRDKNKVRHLKYRSMRDLGMFILEHEKKFIIKEPVKIEVGQGFPSVVVRSDQKSKRKKKQIEGQLSLF